MDAGADSYMRALDKVVLIAALASIVLLVLILVHVDNPPDESPAE